MGYTHTYTVYTHRVRALDHNAISYQIPYIYELIFTISCIYMDTYLCVLMYLYIHAFISNFDAYTRCLNTVYGNKTVVAIGDIVSSRVKPAAHTHTHTPRK